MDTIHVVNSPCTECLLVKTGLCVLAQTYQMFFRVKIDILSVCGNWTVVFSDGFGNIPVCGNISLIAQYFFLAYARKRNGKYLRISSNCKTKCNCCVKCCNLNCYNLQKKLKNLKPKKLVNKMEIIKKSSL